MAQVHALKALRPVGTRLGTGQREQLIDETRAAFRGRLDLCERMGEHLGVALPQCELGLGLEARQRSAQLMRCIRDEAALCRQRRVEPAEQPVDGTHHRPHFARRGRFVERAQVAVRAVPDRLDQRLERPQPATDAEPYQSCCQHEQQHLRQQHADQDLAREDAAFHQRFGHRDRGATAPTGARQRHRDRRHPQRLAEHARVVEQRLAARQRVRRRRSKLAVAEHEIAALVAHPEVDLIVLVGFEELQRRFRQVDPYQAGLEPHATGEREHFVRQRPIVREVGEAEGETVGEEGIRREEQRERNQYPGEQGAA